MRLAIEQLEPRLCRAASAFEVIGLPAEVREFPFRGEGINVAVIDSGADLTAPYIRGAVAVAGVGSPADGSGHGSFIAAEIHEVAPEAGIYSVKVLDDQGSGTTDTGEAGIQWVLDHYVADHISVLNYSLEYTTDDPTIDADFAKLAQAGVTVCVAAGNDQATMPNVLNAAANCPDVISVGATWTQFMVNVNYNGATDYQTQTDKIAAYSQRSNKLSLLAPGDVQVGDHGWTGTSMAAPLVAGGAVLIHEALASVGRPTDEAAILAVMQATGKSIFDGATPLDDVEHTGDTFARLDLEAAIAAIVPPTPLPPPITLPVPPAPRLPAPQSPTNATFVASLYQHVLGRQPDAPGLSYWLSQLGAGRSRADVAAAIWGSQEHLRHHAAESAEQLYESLLGRPGDAAGLAYFAGKPEAFIAESILASPEFFNASDE